MFETPQYELGQNLMTLVNVMCIIYIQEIENHSIGRMKYWMYVQIVLNILWLFELISDFVLRGPMTAFKKQFRVWPETVC